MIAVERDAWKNILSRSDGGVDFWHNSIVRILLGATVFSVLGAFGLVAYFIRPSETPLVLHYNVYFGVDLLGVWWQLYALPLLGMLFFFLHTVVAKRFYENTERIASYLMLLSASMLTFGVLVASISMVFINY